MGWKGLIPSEYDECKAYWDWAQTIPVLKEFLIKIPNEGARTALAGKRLKEIGLRPGVPDYVLPVASNSFIGLWIEMKRRDQQNRLKRDSQEDWLKKLQSQRHYAVYAYGWDHARQITMDYLANRI